MLNTIYIILLLLLFYIYNASIVRRTIKRRYIWTIVHHARDISKLGH